MVIDIEENLALVKNQRSKILKKKYEYDKQRQSHLKNLDSFSSPYLEYSSRSPHSSVVEQAAEHLAGSMDSYE
jgi:hypothetical protein